MENRMLRDKDIRNWLST